MRKFSLIALALFSVPLFVNGQQITNSQNLQALQSFKKETEFRNQLDMKSSKISYYLSDWDGGTVYDEDDQITTGKLYRYNIYTDQIEVREVLDPESVKYIVIGARKFIYTSFSEEGLNYNGYFEMLVAGDCKLLVKRRLTFQAGNSSVQAYGSDDAFRIKPVYYIKKGDEPAIKINRDKDVFLRLMADKEKIDKYIKKKSFPFLTVKGMVSIVEKYNNL